MKKLTLLLSFVLIIVGISTAQPWVKNMPQNTKSKDLTLNDYKKAFDEYWAPFNVKDGYYLDENGTKTKAPGWKQFKRWVYFWEPQVDADGRFPSESPIQVFQEYQKKKPLLKSGAEVTANWQSLGPVNSDGGYAGVGRINCVSFHPGNSNTYWVGAASGGLWQTNNNGDTWQCLTDSNPVLGISDILIPPDYATSNTIYLATGDRDASNNYSVGVLKSTNGGETWNSTGLSFQLSEYRMVTRLLMDPNDNNTILAATNYGVYKTTDGGTNWDTQLIAVSFIDMEFKPGDFNTLYGSTKSGDIYVSHDGGSSWNTTMETDFRRIELTVSDDDPSRIYAVVGNDLNALQAIFKSTNSGDSFQEIFSGDDSNLLGSNSYGTSEGGQAWYDLAIAASPDNANLVFVGGINTWRSDDAGQTWTCINHWYGQDGITEVHADKHMLKFRNDGYLFECNDGGVYVSTDNGDSFTDKTNGLVISQIYKVGVSQTKAGNILVGLQDNGTKFYDDGNWDDVLSGDGMDCLIDYTDENIQYASSQNGNFSRTNNSWGNRTSITPPDAGNGSWVTPIVIDPADHNTIYVGYADIWKSEDQGNNWSRISDINLEYKFKFIAIAPSNSNYIYAADGNSLFKTENGGVVWEDFSDLLPGVSYLTSLTVKENDPNTIWITCGRYDNNAVFQSTNGGQNWTNISEGLPELPVYTVVQNKQETNKVHLYAGSEIGVYFKDGDKDWELFANGLPNVTTRELEIYYNNDPAQSKLRLATYGRGLWESNLVDVSTVNPMIFDYSTTTQNNVSVVEIGGKVQDILSVHVVTSGSSFPLNTTQFSFNTNGTTNAAADIQNARLWYTGTSSLFSTITEFGDVVISPNGSFSITGSQVLQADTNYFWLTYDVNEAAMDGNKLDAECTAVVVSGDSYIPIVTAPAGSREIVSDPCTYGIINFPWTEDFETDSLPNCWAQDYVDGNLDWKFQNGGYVQYVPNQAHSGLINALLFNENQSRTKIISPKLDISNLQKPLLSFWHTQGDWGGDQDELSVFYKTSANGEWVLLAEFTDDISDWTNEIIELPNPSSDYYICFEGLTNYGYGICLDDISVDSSTLLADFNSNKTLGVVPLTVSFFDKSNGNPTSWSWDFGDGENSNDQNPTHTYTSPGNYDVKLIASVGNISDTILKGDFIIVNDANDCPQHFHPVWEGTSGTDHMNIFVTDAKYNGVDLEAGDEVSVFDGDLCVGYSKVVQTIDGFNYLSIIVSGDDGSGNGFTSGDAMIFKIWDCSVSSEYTVQNVTYYDGDNITTPQPFEIGGTAVVELNGVSELCQTITFNNGWNIFSIPVLPKNIRMDTVFQSLIDRSSLVKIQNETGSSLEYLAFMNSWNNEIGDIGLTEGYKIKVSKSDSLEICGQNVGYPYVIPLSAGWNIIGYPRLSEANAMDVLQPLMDKETLIKVQDESGNSIEYLFFANSWVDNIHDFTPGKGYKVKLNFNDSLWINESYPKSTATKTEQLATLHFQPEFEGNGVDHMNLNLLGIPINVIKAGDELALFDGETCVGAVTIMPHHIKNQIVSMAASAADGQGMQGFNEGNPFTLKLYSAKENQEFILEPEILQGTPTFVKHESTVVSLEKYATTGLEGITTPNFTEINCYPNPFSKEITVEINLTKDSEVTVEVLNQIGQRIKFVSERQLITSGLHKLTWNGGNEINQQVAPGIYHLRVKIDDEIVHRKIIYTR